MPKELKNKSVTCTPLVHNKGVSCTEQSLHTEAAKGEAHLNLYLVTRPEKT